MSKNRKAKQRFIGIPHQAYLEPAFAQLSHRARSLLIDIAAQYNGHNNGDLHCTWQLMKDKGWRSRTTLYKARDELLQAGFIETTRQAKTDYRLRGKLGKLGTGPNLYAVTWAGIDEKDKGWPLDAKPNSKPSLRFRRLRVVVNE